LESKEAWEKVLGEEVNTLIIPYKYFYLAEDYHQKYYLQGDNNLSSEIKGYFKEFQDFVNSTAAARLNGIIGGYANPNLVEAELSEYGLSVSGINDLERYLK
jgi:peptide-methionine (S)-S-oxide reductase